jgi:hypothetical protein
MTRQHLRGIAASLFLSLAVGCGGLDPADAGFEREASGDGKADQTAVTLSSFAGRFDQIDPDGNVLEGSTLAVSVKGQSVHATIVVDGNARTIMKGEVGAEEVEKYTVSSQGFFGPAQLERRKIVTSLRRVGRTLERRTEMYSWEVSLKVWEDWTLYGVISDTLTILDGDQVTLDHHESQYDSRTARYLYLRSE